MNPKNHKEFTKDVANKLEVSEDLVRSFVDFYYSKVRKNLSDLTYPYINIENLGLFSLRKNMLDKEVEKYKNFIKSLNLNKYGDFEKQVSAKRNLDVLLNAQLKYEEILAKKREFKIKQNESKKNL